MHVFIKVTVILEEEEEKNFDSRHSIYTDRFICSIAMEKNEEKREMISKKTSSKIDEREKNEAIAPSSHFLLAFFFSLLLTSSLGCVYIE